MNFDVTHVVFIYVYESGAAEYLGGVWSVVAVRGWQLFLPSLPLPNKISQEIGKNVILLAHYLIL